MTFTLRVEAVAAIKEALTRRGGTVTAVRQVKGPKKYCLQLTADLADGSTRSWYSDSIKYPKRNKAARNWSAEVTFAVAWRPSHYSGSAVLSTDDAGYRSNVAPALAPRTKQPRDCQPAPEIHTPPAKRSAREGGDRSKGGFARKKRLRALLDR